MRNGRLLKILVVISVLFSVSETWAQEAGSAQTDTARQDRSPTGAMLRSLALPGWGQFYNQRVIKGSAIAAAEVGSAVAFFVDRFRDDEGRSTSDRNLALIAMVATLFYSVVDAYVDAHLDAVEWADVEVGPSKAQQKLKLRLRIEF